MCVNLGKGGVIMELIKIKEIDDDEIIEISEEEADDAFFCCLVTGGRP